MGLGLGLGLRFNYLSFCYLSPLPLCLKWFLLCKYGSQVCESFADGSIAFRGERYDKKKDPKDPPRPIAPPRRPVASRRRAYTYKSSVDESIAGLYECQPPQNDEHHVTIRRPPSSPQPLQWTNRAGVAWGLTPVEDSLTASAASTVNLTVSADCPHYAERNNVEVVRGELGQPIELRFGAEVYKRIGDTPSRLLRIPEQPGGAAHVEP